MTDALDARLPAAARALMTTLLGDLWRARDYAAIYAALRSERVRGEESMRERAIAAFPGEPPGRLRLTNEEIRTVLRALPTTDQETTHG